MTSRPPDARTSTPGAPRQDGFGFMLRAAREARGLTCQGVADALRLSPRMVEAIEAEDLSRLPPPLFIKGYLRSYAALVGLDEAALMRDFESWVPAADPLRIADVRSRPITDLSDVGRGRQLASAILLLVVVAGGIAWWLRPAPPQPIVAAIDEMPAIEETRIAPDPVPEGLPESPAVAPEGDPATATEHASDSEEDATVESVPSPPPSVETTAAISASKQESPSVAESVASIDSGKPEAALQEQTTSVLKIRYQQDCWTEVRDARGRQLIYRLAKAGSEQEVSGDPPFALYLGYAPGVEVAIDGRPIPIASFIGNSTVARFKLDRPQ